MLPTTIDDYDNGKTYKYRRLSFTVSTKELIVLTTDNNKFNESGVSNQIDVEFDSSDQTWLKRQEKVREAFQHSWNGYVRDAWGYDEYHPISRVGSNLSQRGIGFTIVDSIDTLLIMGLKDEYSKARDWIANTLDFNIDGNFNVFETTIRVLGGLLSAYHLSGNDTTYLQKAIDLGDRLLGAFDSPTGIPYASVNLATREGIPSHFNEGVSSTSEATTLQLEFRYLSYLTNNYDYWSRVEGIMSTIDALSKLDGLAPIYLSPKLGTFFGETITLGARGDSYYEYLLKQYLQTACTERFYRRMYDEAIQGVKKHLISYSSPSRLLFIGETLTFDTTIRNKMDHLVCFMGGNLALGATQGEKLNNAKNLSENDLEDLKIGRELTKTCAQMYFHTETGLAPEIVHFNTQEGSTEDLFIKAFDRHNLLRPETVESLFILWRITGDVQYRIWGWEIFQAFEKYSKLQDGGYTSLDDVTMVPPAETLKYFYLLFGTDDVLPLNKYVFNTEAHPLPIFKPSFPSTMHE
ncbi:12310_t:CDS:2 [Acaulospora morrowiae]|uniref:alpha-1,2-Mannosidase n=1 Tax=Acaulospora morrowiae TaxID=94023 RepID=A0A9N8YRM1_9GLOM|nr:12310_t:CDS:2 [Acaulospora morrowiae]